MAIEKEKFKKDMNNSSTKYEYLCVYKINGNRHCIYVKSFDEVQRELTCINSHGEKDQFPKIVLKDVEKLYRVECCAFEISSNTNFQPMRKGSTSSGK